MGDLELPGDYVSTELQSSVDISKNAQRMIQYIPDILKLPDSTKEVISDRFRSYTQHERLYHYVPLPVDHEDKQREDQERQDLVESLFGQFDKPGTIYAGFRTYDHAPLRTEIYEIDRLLNAPSYVSTYLGLGLDILEPNWSMPDGESSSMVFILKPEAKGINGHLAFNAEDTAEYEHTLGIGIDWDIVSKLILTIPALNTVREEFLVRMGPNRPKNVFGRREVMLPKYISSDLIDTIVVDDKIRPYLTPYLPRKIGDIPLGNLVTTRGEYQVKHNQRLKQGQLIQQEILAKFKA